MTRRYLAWDFVRDTFERSASPNKTARARASLTVAQTHAKTATQQSAHIYAQTTGAGLFLHVNMDNDKEKLKPPHNSVAALTLDTSGHIHTQYPTSDTQDTTKITASSLGHNKRLSNGSIERAPSPRLQRLIDELKPMTPLPSPLVSPVGAGSGPKSLFGKEWRDTQNQPTALDPRLANLHASRAQSISVHGHNHPHGGRQLAIPPHVLEARRVSTSSVSSENYGPYSVIRQIGTGSFSVVKLALDTRASPDTARHVALKLIEQSKMKASERFKSSVDREVELLRAIDHASIVKLLDVIPGHPIYHVLVLEYVPGGELWDLISESKARVSENMVKHIFKQLLNAVEYLHSKNIVHRDLKLENVLLVSYPSEMMPSSPTPEEETTTKSALTTETTVEIKLTDFGLARFIDPADPVLTTRCGSEEYAAPELLMGQPYDGRSTDIWALGIILYIMLVGYPPFPQQGKTRKQFWYSIASMQYKWPTERRPSPAAIKCVEMMLKGKGARASIPQIRECDWLSS